jgi:hypothetical protein
MTAQRFIGSVLATGVLALGLGATPAAAAPANPPRVGLTVDDGTHDSGSPGDRSYVVTVTNYEKSEVDGVRVRVDLPPDSTFVRADQGGTQDGGHAWWTVKLPPKGTAKLTVVTDLSAAAVQAQALVAIACLLPATGTQALFCTSDIDTPPPAPPATAAAPHHGAPVGWLIAGGSLLVVVALGLVGLGWWRRRRRGRAQDSEDRELVSHRM